ncbi:MAG TPA: hypothetical protein VFB45_15395 [Pseudolabrys sp.]|nr:hypothetical protein [Pseudolabrys sp.]
MATADAALDAPNAAQWMTAIDSPPAAPPAKAPAGGGGFDFAGGMRALDQRMQGTLAAKERETQPVISAARAENAKPLPQAPQLEKVGEPPKSNTGQAMQEWLMPAIVLSALAGAFTRQHVTSALNAFSSAVEGYKAGNLAQYEQKYREWEANSKKAIQNNKAALDEYDAVWKNRKLSIDQKMNEIQLIAAKYQDRMTYEAAAQKNFTMVAQVLQRQEMQTERLNQAYEKMKLQGEAMEAKVAGMKTPENAQKWLAAIQSEQDPEKKKSMQAAYNHIFAGNTTGGLEQLTLKQMVDRRLSGDKTVLQNIGRGIQGAANVQEFNNALAAEMEKRGMTGADLTKVDQQYVGDTAYQRTAGGMGARVENASNEVVQVLPQAIESSRNLPRGQIVPLNKLIQSWQQGTSDPAYNDFIMANFALINAYTRAMNPQGVPRIAERLEQKAIGILSEANSPQAYEVQVQRLWKEVQASKKAVVQTREGRTSGDINSPVPGMTPPPSNDGWSVQEVH